MGLFTYPKRWNETGSAEPFYSSDLHADFDAVGDVVNGNIENVNIKSVSALKLTEGTIPTARYGAGTIPGASIENKSITEDQIKDDLDMSERGLHAEYIGNYDAQSIVGVIGDLQLDLDLKPQNGLVISGGTLSRVQLPGGFGIDEDHPDWSQYVLLYRRECKPDEFGLDEFPMKEDGTPQYSVDMRCDKSFVLWQASWAYHSGNWSWKHNYGISDGYFTIVDKTASKFYFQLVGRGYCMTHWGPGNVGHTAQSTCGIDNNGEGGCRQLFAAVGEGGGVGYQARLTFIINRLPFGKVA